MRAVLLLPAAALGLTSNAGPRVGNNALTTEASRKLAFEAETTVGREGGVAAFHNFWRREGGGGAAAAAACALVLVGGGASPAFAENELAALGSKGFDSSLIDTECFTSQCKLPATNCLESNDCRKGMTCTAKCLGDNACITGCFAKYGNAEMSDLLECSVEKHGCIKIAILEGGADTALTAPKPPAALVSNFDPQSLDGTWYKVMGWNSRYDCFDCQRNTFAAEKQQQSKLQKPAAKRNFDVDVEFSMPRPPRGFMETQASSYPLRLSEKLVFDEGRTPPGQGHPQVMKRFKNFATPPANAASMANDDAASGLRRHASTVGHMFGLTFWENWSVLGENAPGEEQFKFVYYTGRTTQNTYDGAFVYAREPTLPEAAKRDVYAIARTAGLEPEKFCKIRNDCETCSNTFAEVDRDRNYETLGGRKGGPSTKGLFMGAAQADDELQLLQPTAAEVSPIGASSLAPASSSKLPGWLYNALTDASDYLEDPHQTSRWLFGQQVKNTNDPTLLR